TGATGAAIALHGHERGHTVTLLTSHPEVVDRLRPGVPPPAERWAVRRYRTFDDLRGILEEAVRRGGPDAGIHSAALRRSLSGGRSRRNSGADLMVANTLEGAAFWAYLGPLPGGYQRVNRHDLVRGLLDAVERLHGEKSHG